MSDLYYYAIDGEVSAEPVPRDRVPIRAEWVCQEGKSHWVRPERLPKPGPVKATLVKCWSWLVAKRREVIPVVAVCLVAAGGLWFLSWAAPGSSSLTSEREYKPEVEASVSVVPGGYLRIDSRTDLGGRLVTLHLNGSPLSRSTYRTTVAWPEGEPSALVPLNDFSRPSDGRYFSPFTHRPTEVWIGGNGFMHTQYRFR